MTTSLDRAEAEIREAMKVLAQLHAAYVPALGRALAHLADARREAHRACVLCGGQESLATRCGPCDSKMLDSAIDHGRRDEGDVVSKLPRRHAPGKDGG